jgi:hypothetical protein
MRTTRTVGGIRALLLALLAAATAPAALAQNQTFTPAQYVTANYYAALGRAPDWTGWNFWYWMFGYYGWTQAELTYNGFLTSTEYRSRCGTNLAGTQYYEYGGTSGYYSSPYSCSSPANNNDFLTLLYLDALQREPDVGGWDFWYCGMVPSTTCGNAGNGALSQSSTLAAFVASGTGFVNTWGVSNSVTPETLSSSGAGGGGTTQYVTIGYSGSSIGSGYVYIGQGDLTSWDSSLTGCEVEWWSSGQVSLWQVVSGSWSQEYGPAQMGSGQLLNSSGICSLNLGSGQASYSGGTLTLALSYTSTMYGSQPVWSYGADSQGWPTLPWTELGSVSIYQPTMYAISGQILLYPSYSAGGASGSPLSGLPVVLSGSSSGSVVTNSAGVYTFTVASGGNYTVTPQAGGYFFNPSSLSVQSLNSNTTLSFPALAENCSVVVSHTESTDRTAGNQVTGSGSQYPAQVVEGNWTLTMTATLLFTPSGGGSQQTAGTNTTTFNWDPNTPPGSASTEVVNVVSALQPYGSGSYQTSVSYTGTCGGQTVNLCTNGSACSPYTSSSLAVQVPTISPPAGSPYPQGEYAIWYLGGQPSQSGYYTSTTLTGAANLGPCSTCNPVYNWIITQSPNNGASGDPVAFGSPNSTVTAVTSLTSSGGPVFDTGIVFSVDGFLSAPFMMNLNTPTSTRLLQTVQIANPAGCPNPNPNLYGGYDNQYSYEILDLGGNPLVPIVVNEENDEFQDIYQGIVGWHYASFWVHDDVWYPPATAPPGASTWGAVLGANAITDNISAWVLSGEQPVCAHAWVPDPVQPQGLNVAVQDTPQYFYAASATTGAGVFVRSDFQTWYTDHAVCTQGGLPGAGGQACQ